MALVSRRSVVITGAGAVCAAGDRPAAIHEALCSGTRALSTSAVLPQDVAAGYEVGEVRDFNPQSYLGKRSVGPLDRTGRLAAAGVELALADSGWTIELRRESPLGLVLGTMFCSVKTIGEFDRRAQQAGPEYASPLDFSNTVLNAAAGQVGIWHHLRGVNSTIAAGAVSGVHALGYAVDLIRRGRADAIVAGGVEELCFESFHGFRRAGYLAPPVAERPGCSVPFDARRTGIALGEGSAFLVVEGEEAAVARGARILGRVGGFAARYDPMHDAAGAEGPNALSDAIRRALRDAGAESSDIGFVVSSASGSPALDAREAAGIRCGIGASAPVTAVKSTIGEALGASGALQAIAALESLRTGNVPGIAGLDQPDPAIDLALLGPGARALPSRMALVTAVAHEGNCCALVLAGA